MKKRTSLLLIVGVVVFAAVVLFAQQLPPTLYTKPEKLPMLNSPGELPPPAEEKPPMLKREPEMQMHRLQATTRDPSGWYIAASTQGSFSVLIPIPFNDFTVIDDDPKVGRIKTHTVGAKSAEGIKFSATETPIIKGRSPTDLAAFPNQFLKPGQKVSDIDSAPYADYSSVSFSLKGPATGAYMRCVKTPKSLILLILEYPDEQAKAAEGFRSVFLSSLKITKTEPAGAANRSQPSVSQ